MQDLLNETERLHFAEDRSNMYLAEKLKRQDLDRKRARLRPQVPEEPAVQNEGDLGMQVEVSAAPVEEGRMFQDFFRKSVRESWRRPGRESSGRNGGRKSRPGNDGNR
jgi:hypothetical protein